MFETLVFCTRRAAVFISSYEFVARPEIGSDDFVGAVERAVVDLKHSVSVGSRLEKPKKRVYVCFKTLL